MSGKVYVVRAHCGDYCDRSDWVDSVWTVRVHADARAEALGGVKGRQLKESDYDPTHAQVEEFVLDMVSE